MTSVIEVVSVAQVTGGIPNKSTLRAIRTDKSNLRAILWCFTIALHESIDLLHTVDGIVDVPGGVERGQGETKVDHVRK